MMKIFTRAFHGSSCLEAMSRSMRRAATQRRIKKHEKRLVEIAVMNKMFNPVLGDVEASDFIKELRASMAWAGKIEDANQLRKLERNPGVTLCSPIDPQTPRPSQETKAYFVNQDEIERISFGARQAALNRLEPHDLATSVTFMQEERKRQAINKILSLEQANNASFVHYNIQNAVEDFQRFPGDTGSSEVQAAVSTVRIHNLTAHLARNRKDYSSDRGLRQLIQRRQNILKYLRRSRPDRYFWCLNRLGLTDEAITEPYNFSLKEKSIHMPELVGNRKIHEKRSNAKTSTLTLRQKVGRRSYEILKQRASSSSKTSSI